MRVAEARLSIGFWSWDIDAVRLSCSSGLYSLLGINAASVKLDLVFLESLVHPADRMVIDDPSDFARDSRQASRQFRVIRPDGQLRHLLSEATTFFDRDGRALRVVTVVSDVTERHEIGRRLGRKRALLHAIAEIVDGVLWVSDENGRLLERFGGHFSEAKVGPDSDVENWRGGMHPDDAARLPQLWRDTVGRRQPYVFSPRLRRADGRYQQFHVRGLPFAAEYSRDPHYGGISSGNLGILSAPAFSDERHDLTLSPAQVRACRALLDWTAEMLAQQAAISVSTVRRLESADSSGQGESTRLVIRAFREAGLTIYRGADGRISITDAA